MHVKICMLQLKKYWEGNIYIYETFYIWNAILENKKSLKSITLTSTSKKLEKQKQIKFKESKAGISQMGQKGPLCDKQGLCL